MGSAYNQTVIEEKSLYSSLYRENDANGHDKLESFPSARIVALSLIQTDYGVGTGQVGESELTYMYVCRGTIQGCM